MEIQEYKENREMEQEIFLEDGIGGEHRVRYLDVNRVIVQTVTRYLSVPEAIGLSMPAKVKVYQLDTFPYTESLKTQILEFHAQFPDAK